VDGHDIPALRALDSKRQSGIHIKRPLRREAGEGQAVLARCRLPALRLPVKQFLAD
jgi:hypothetical protein